MAALCLATVSALAQPSVPDAGVPETDNVVYALVQSGNTVYVGGLFTTIGGLARNRLAAFDATTGAVDSSWDPDIGGGTAPAVRALVVEGGRIHVGGRFTTVNGGIARNNLAAFELANGVNTGQVDAAWDPDVTGGTAIVSALATDGSLIYAGGVFTTVNGATGRNGLAAFPIADGISTGTATAWDPDLGGGLALAWDIEVDGSTVYVGGSFTTVNAGATARNNLAAVDAATGLADAAWDPDITGGSLPAVQALAVDGSRLYAGGKFTTVNGGVARNNLAAFELANGVNAGAVDAAWDPGVSILSDGVRALHVAISKLYVGGNFTTVSGVTRNSAAALSLADGASPAVLDSWDPSMSGAHLSGPTSMTSVYSIISSASGLLVGGDFTEVGSVAHDSLVGFASTVPIELSLFTTD
jgi:hypothetical protein